MNRLATKLASFLFTCSLALCPAQAGPTLAFNDTCATAELVGLTAGGWSILPNRSITTSDPVDHYRGTLLPGYEARFWAVFSQQNGNLDLRLWNSNCTVLLASSTTTSDDELVTWVNSGATSVEVVCEVFLNGTGAVQYDLYHQAELLDCLVPDAWEENDSCGSPKVIPFNTFLFEQGRTVQQGDDDYYEVTLPAYTQLDVLILHDVGAADIDASLHDAGCANLLQVSSTQGDELLTLDNPSVTPRTFVIHVYLADNTPCAQYTLQFNGQPGSNYCTSSPNSTGQPATLRGWGLPNISANDLILVSGPVPDNAFGIYFYGPNAGSIPFGNGTLCVTPTVVRSPVFQALTGSVLWVLDFPAQASTAHPIVAGATYNFQCWFRDPAGGGSQFNLSDGYRVAFIP